jgi:hypothetical protein
MCSSSGGQNCIIQHLVSSHWNEWSKITKIEFYKYEHKVVKVTYEFFGCNYCVFLHCKHVMSCTVYIYPVVKLIKKVLCLFTLYICWVYLVIKSYKLLINYCIYMVTCIWLSNLLKIYDVYLHYISKEGAFNQLLKLYDAYLLYMFAESVYL